MVNDVKRKKNDLFAYRPVAFLFKNPRVLFGIRVFVLLLFITALAYGFSAPNQREYHFNVTLFWSLFWPFIMVVSLGTLGSFFCSICPHAFLGRVLTRYGLKRTMPKWLNQPLIGLFLLVCVYWLPLYLFPDFFKSPLRSSLFFTIFTLLAWLNFFLFKEMSYCKSLCPIGAITASFSKVSFTYLKTYADACLTCKGLECAKACPYRLAPFTFEKRASMQQCKLCMECAHACEAVGWFVQKPSASLFKISKAGKSYEVWTYIIIACTATLSMIFHNALGNSPIAQNLPWKRLAHFLESTYGSFSFHVEGLIVLLFATLLGLGSTIGAYRVASYRYQISFRELLMTAGYAIAPIIIFGGMAQTLPFFLIHYGNEALNGILQLFNPLATPLDVFVPKNTPWLRGFALFHFMGFFIGVILLHVRIKRFIRSPYPWGLFLLLGAFHWLYGGLILMVIGVFVFA